MYFHPSSLNQLIGSRAMPRAKKGQQKFPVLKKTTGLCHSFRYYSMISKHNKEPFLHNRDREKAAWAATFMDHK